MKTEIQIKSINGDAVLFENIQENNTIKDTLEKAAKQRANLLYADLDRADLRGADLRDADLCGANLREADLRGADLRGADLYGADLREANLNEADLHGAVLSETRLCGAILHGARLSGADLRCADLSEANLYGADLLGADLRHAINVPYIPLACPSDGMFIGWKKIVNYLVKLEIPEDAKRSSATTNKCRCSKAKVLAITDLDGISSFEQVTNDSYTKTTYRVGEMVYPDSFDEDRWNECSHGIHFFINKQDAINYY